LSVEPKVARAVDALLEATIAGSFSRIGIEARRRLGHWSDPPRMDGKVVVVTGASSGIGRAAGVQLARLGATVWLVGRDRFRVDQARAAAIAASGNPQVRSAIVNLVDEQQVRSFSQQVFDSHDRLDGLVHNAGALLAEYRQAPDGTELTVATHVLAPFRLSCLLHPLLRAAEASVIVTVTSGGMYSQRFDLDRLEMTAADYRGVTAYARAKRAQVLLAHEWARRWGPDGVASYAAHPGWVDTPGLASGLPSFSRLGPLLRTPEEGADTMVWLVAGAADQRDGLWHDRRRRGEYYRPGTRADPGAGSRLWDWCVQRTGGL
jgi:dehydrogenase/reductase SDR family protein 12